MTTDADVSEYLQWGMAVVHAAALDSEDASGDLVRLKMEEVDSPQELLMMLFGLIEAGAVYVRAAADAKGVPVADMVQAVGLITME